MTDEPQKWENYCKKHYVADADPYPDGCCSCHLHPPCWYCLRWAGDGLLDPEDFPDESASCPECGPVGEYPAIWCSPENGDDTGFYFQACAEGLKFGAYIEDDDDKITLATETAVDLANWILKHAGKPPS